MMGGLLPARSLASLLLLLAGSSAEYFFIGDDNAIVDAQGRTRLFHGVNAVEKLPPYLPSSNATGGAALNDDDLEALAGWGFNVVRLGVLWRATMPSGPGEVNATYLEEVRSLVGRLHARGIYTLVDMHQDVLSGFTCGEGIPDWAFSRALELVGFNASADRENPRRFPKPLPYDDVDPDPATGKPPLEACQTHGFFTYYLTYESEAAWHALYSEPEMWGYFGDHWAAVAGALAGEPGLLGFEMLNEPWPARGAAATDEDNDDNNDNAKAAHPSASANPGSASSPTPPGVLSDAATLQPMYEALYSRVRASEAEALRARRKRRRGEEGSADGDDAAAVPSLFFFEPLVLGSYLDVLPNHTTSFPKGGPPAWVSSSSSSSSSSATSSSGAWVSASAAAAEDAPKNSSVFAYHSYCASEPDGSPADWGLCEVLVRGAWEGAARNLNALGPSVGGFLTEFGAVSDDPKSLALLRLQTGGADSLLQSWAYWTYKSFDDITTQNAGTETFFVSSSGGGGSKASKSSRSKASNGGSMDENGKSGNKGGGDAWQDVTLAGSLQSGKVKALARTFARAVAGTPSAMRFDDTTGAFELSYSTAPPASVAAEGIGGQGATTEIFLHTGFYYPNGFSVAVEASGGNTATWEVIDEGPGYMVGGDRDETTNVWAVVGVTAEAAADGAPFDVTVHIGAASSSGGVE